LRQVVLDTETTGLEVSQGHRIIEIGCVELVNRRLTGRHYHQYINPERAIDEGAMEVHGITNEFVADKPSFESIAQEFLDFVTGSELVIHNAPFDIGFLNRELSMTSSIQAGLDTQCEVIDTLIMARQKHPGQRNSLDALCRRYAVDNSKRELHGALLDAEILADVYLLMTGGQRDLLGAIGGDLSTGGEGAQGRSDRRPVQLVGQARVIKANPDEEEAHQQRLAAIEKVGSTVLWSD
jgi:DNA polymerase-3 subunit epsilon